MEGTVIIRKRKRVNRFSADTYDLICQDILWANKTGLKGEVVVKHSKDQGGRISPIILEVLESNGIPKSKIKKYGKYNGLNIKWRFVFDSNETAYKAVDIINKMALPDKINRSKVSSSGYAETEGNLKVKVDLVKGDDGSIQLKEGSSYIPVNQDKADSSSNASQTTSSRKWLIIGGAVFAVSVIVVLLILKKKKIIK